MTVAGSSQPIRVSSSDFSVAANAVAPPVSDPSRRRMQSSAASVMVNANGAIVEVSQARVQVPLFVIPAMDADQLARINVLTVTIPEPPAAAPSSADTSPSTVTSPPVAPPPEEEEEEEDQLKEKKSETRRQAT